MDIKSSKLIKALFLVLVLIPGVLLRLQVFNVAGYYTVVYGNTATHISWATVFLNTGEFPLWEPSYGGKPSVYVPIYRLVLTATAWLLGDVLLASNVITVASAIAPIGLFLVAWGLTRSFYPSLIAVLVSETSTQLLIYSARPLPQFLGMTMLPIAVYLFLEKKYVATVVTSFLISMTHQETALVLVLVLSAYLVITFVLSTVQRLMRPQKNPSTKTLMQRAELVGGLASVILPVISYLVWQSFILGTSNIFELAQFVFHEHSIVTWDHLIQVGVACLIFGFLGAVIFLVRGGINRNKILMGSWLLVCVLASKNEIFAPLAPQIFPVMCDRFLAYLAQVLSVFAAIAVLTMVESSFDLSSIIGKVRRYSTNL